MISRMQHFFRPIPAQPVFRSTLSFFLADSYSFPLVPQDRNAYKSFDVE